MDAWALDAKPKSLEVTASSHWLLQVYDTEVDKGTIRSYVQTEVKALKAVDIAYKEALPAALAQQMQTTLQGRG